MNTISWWCFYSTENNTFSMCHPSLETKIWQTHKAMIWLVFGHYSITPVSASWSPCFPTTKPCTVPHSMAQKLVATHWCVGLHGLQTSCVVPITTQNSATITCQTFSVLLTSHMCWICIQQGLAVLVTTRECHCPMITRLLKKTILKLFISL